jgi:hypothetical protein
MALYLTRFSYSAETWARFARGVVPEQCRWRIELDGVES